MFPPIQRAIPDVLPLEIALSHAANGDDFVVDAVPISRNWAEFLNRPEAGAALVADAEAMIRQTMELA